MFLDAHVRPVPGLAGMELTSAGFFLVVSLWCLWAVIAMPGTGIVSHKEAAKGLRPSRA